MKLDFKRSNISRFQDIYRIVVDVRHLWSDSEPGVNTVGIHVENHEGHQRILFIFIRFDHMKLGEKGS